MKTIVTDPGSNRSILVRIAKNSLVVLTAKMIDISSALLILMILSRLLGVSRFGDFAFINSVILAFQPLINLELNTILIREMSREHDNQRVFLGGGLLLKAILIGFFVVAAIAVDQIIQFNPLLRTAFYLAVAGEIFQQVNWVYSAVFMARERMEFEPLLVLVFRGISVGGVVLLGLICPEGRMADMGFVLVFAIMSSAQAVRALSGIIVSSRFLKSFSIDWSMKVAMDLLRQSWIMGVATFCTGLSLRVDVFFLRHFKGPEAVALFHLPHMYTLQVQILATSIVMALFPLVSRWGTDAAETDRFRQVQEMGLRLMNTMGLSLALISALIPSWIIVVLGGSAFIHSVRVLCILCWCIPILFLNYLGANLLTAVKRQHLLIYGAATSLLLNIILDLIWVPRYGTDGAAYATVISYALQLIIVLSFLVRFSGLQLRTFRSLLVPWFISLSASALGWWLNTSMYQHELIGIFLRITLALVGIGSMIAMLPARIKEQLWLLRKPDIRTSKDKI